jgi:hypothetical protein
MVPRLGGLLALAAAFLVVLPVVAAHPAPNPRDQDTRLLADWIDDCGPTQAVDDCRGSDDLIALDLIERHDSTLGDVAVFRLFLDHGKAGSHDDRLTFDSPSGTKTFDYLTSDDQAFTGKGFDAVTDAVPINDGSRFYVEGTVRLSSLGNVGDPLAKFHVDALIDGKVGDYMPGGCNNTIGTCTHQDCSQGGCYERATYALRGPSYYAALTLNSPGTQSVGAGAESIVQLTLQNLLRNTHQTFQLQAAGAQGVQARFHDPATGAYTDSPSQPLDGSASASGGTTAVHLALTGQTAGAQGTLTITAVSDLGGVTTLQVPYTVTAQAPSGSSTSKHSPASATPALTLLAVALLVRRRHA